MWIAFVVLILVAMLGYAASRDEVRMAAGVKMAEWALRLGGAAVLDYNDKVRLANTPTYGHRVYTSPDGRVLVIDPIEVRPETFTAQAGAVEMPKRCVLQITSYGQPPSRAELSHVEALRLGDAMANYLGHVLWRNGPGLSAGESVPQSQR